MKKLLKQLSRAGLNDRVITHIMGQMVLPISAASPFNVRDRRNKNTVGTVTVCVGNDPLYLVVFLPEQHLVCMFESGSSKLVF